MKTSAPATLAATTALFLATGCQDAEPPAPDPEEEAVVAVVQQLFEAMRTNDSTMAANTFHPAARVGRAGDNGISFGHPQGLIGMIAAPKEEVYDEPIWDWVVNVDGRLAQMWTKYAFYMGDTFSHCGSDAFELYKGRNGWQITQLVDTRRTEDCWYPPGREPEGAGEGDGADS